MPTGFLVPEGASLTNVFTVTLPTTGWSVAGDGYLINRTVRGILASDVPVVDVAPSDDMAETLGFMRQFSQVWRVTTSNDKITVYAKSVPATELPIRLTVVR